MTPAQMYGPQQPPAMLPPVPFSPPRLPGPSPLPVARNVDTSHHELMQLAHDFGDLQKSGHNQDMGTTLDFNDRVEAALQKYGPERVHQAFRYAGVVPQGMSLTRYGIPLPG